MVDGDKSCEFCGKPVCRRVALNAGFSGRLCPDCDVIFTEAVHDPEIRQSVNAEFYLLDERIKLYRRRRRELQQRYAETERFITQHVGHPLKAVLEVGSNIGVFADYLRRQGANVETIEVNVALRDYQKTAQGLVCYRSLEEVPLGRRYDLIVFMDVLEHISGPARVLLDVRSLLSDEGVIFLQLPNKNSMIAAVVGTNWSWWSAPDHLYHFSTRGIECLARSGGFSCLAMRTVSPILDDLTQIPKVGRFAGLFFHLAGIWNVNPLIPYRRGSMIQALLRPSPDGSSSK